MNKTLEEIGKAGKSASLYMNSLSTREKNDILVAIATALESNTSHVLEENNKDMEQARRKNLAPALLDRLLLTSERLKNIAQDVLHVSSLPDPVGQILDGSTVNSGLRICRKRVPLGVVGVIYEARPNVTVDVASLCLKTGNAVILRGGRETVNTNRILVSIIQRTLDQYGLPVTAVQFIESPDRQIVSEMLKLDKYIDMIIPRGGSALQQLCKEISTIPVIIGGIGVCHTFIDSNADLQKSLPVIDNAKTQRPSVCNALETLLVHESIANDFLPMLAERLGSKGVIFHACPKALSILENVGTNVIPVKSEDYAQEWLTLDLNIKIVKNLQQALEHIRTYSSGHSESILTENINNAENFVMQVDAAAIYVNASTRFTDGGEFGLGAEVAVSTQKLHARGPMGLDALTTYKWIAHGNYSTRE